jgi:hypothetical protein
MSEEGRKKLKDLAQAIREKTARSDEARHKKGLLLIELMARERGLAPSTVRAAASDIALMAQRDVMP